MDTTREPRYMSLAELEEEIEWRNENGLEDDRLEAVFVEFERR